MSRAERLFWVCGVSAALVFVAMAVITITTLEPEGLRTFDARLFGYEPAEAQAYLAALERAPGARETYLGVMRQLDTIFPALLCIALCGALWLNAQRWPSLGRAILLLLPIGYLVLDLMENAAVAEILRIGVGVSEDKVITASALTRLKWLSLGAAFVVALILWRQRRQVSP